MKRNIFAVTIVAALALGTGVLSACQPNAVPGRGCAPEGDFGIGKGDDGPNTYRCVNGHWQWSMTTKHAAELIKQAKDAAAAAATSTTTTSTTTAAPETTTTTTTVPVPPSIEGCYFSTDEQSDVGVTHTDGAEPWAYTASLFDSTDATCTPPAVDTLDVVAASSPAEADSRCVETSGGDLVGGDVVDPDFTPLSGLYFCVAP